MRQKAAKTRARNKQARLAAGNTSTAAVADRPEESEDEPSSDDVLGQLSTLFQKARSQRAGRDRAISEALDIIGRLDPTKYPEIADNEVVQQFVDRVQEQRLKTMDVPPGTILGTGLAARKKPWTKGELLKGKHMPPEEARARGFIEWVEYRPMKNFDVTWNGIRITWPARRLGYFPKSHVDLFEQSIDADAWNERHAAWLFNDPSVPFEPDFNNINASRLRALDESHGEYYVPGGGVIAMAPSADLMGENEDEDKSA